MDDHLTRQLDFVLAIDALKSVQRRSLLLDASRRENSAEHSWHAALAALVLAEHAGEPVDSGRAAAMLLVHDLVEIDCGDTYCYDAEAVASQPEREAVAARRLFGLLPGDQGDALAELWHEFEARETPEARFAHAVDRLLPMLLNFHTDGQAWRQHDVRVAQVEARAAAIGEAAPALGDHVAELVEQAAARGWLRH